LLLRVHGEKSREEKEKANLDKTADQIIREARHEADKIISIAHKESREIVQAAEKGAKAKVAAILKEADEQIEEDAQRAKRAVEKDIVNLVSEATEAVVSEKVDASKDAAVIDKALKGRK
jgi:F-type H+-transporting ATPase subunit b